MGVEAVSNIRRLVCLAANMWCCHVLVEDAVSYSVAGVVEDAICIVCGSSGD